MMRRRHVVLATAIIIVALASCYVGLSYFVVRASLAARPPVCPYVSPTESGLTVEKVELESAGDRFNLAAWLLHPSLSVNRAVVLIHGLSSFAWDGAAPDITQAFLKAGFHVLVFDLRAHGRSDGKILGLGWHERKDVRAAIDLLLSRGFRPGSIGLHGTSYGAATALLSAAAIPEVGAVVADSAFADMRDIMDIEIEKLTGVPSPIATLLRPGLSLVARAVYALDLDLIRPEKKVAAIAPRPVFFIHGSEDDVIPPDHSFRLKAASHNSANEIWIVQGLGHTEAVRQLREKCETRAVATTREIYLDQVTAFFSHSLQ